MAMKTIVTKVTLHVKDMKRSRPFKYDPFGAPVSGKHVVIEIPPETPVSMDDREADKIIARHGGEASDLPPAIVIPPKVEDADDDEIIPLAAVNKPGKVAKPDPA